MISLRSPACLAPALVPFAVLAAAVCAAPSVRAHVIEIDESGVVRTRAQGGAVVWLEPRPEPSVANGATPAHVDGKADSRAYGEKAFNSAVTIAGMPPVPSGYGAPLQRAALLAGISPTLLEAVIWQESRWRPTAVSPVGATGLAQIMPKTARDLGVDPHDPEASLMGAARYLRAMLVKFDNNVELALAAYNAGPERVARARGIPPIPETRAYVAAITQRLARSVLR